MISKRKNHFFLVIFRSINLSSRLHVAGHSLKIIYIDNLVLILVLYILNVIVLPVFIIKANNNDIQIRTKS